MNRVKLFWLAAGPLGAILFALVFAFFAYASVLAIRAQAWDSGTVAFIPAFLLAGLVHRALIPWIGPLMHAMRVFWGLIVINAILRPQAGWFAGDEWVIFPAVGFYLGCYFWLLSNRDALLAMMVNATRK